MRFTLAPIGPVMDGELYGSCDVTMYGRSAAPHSDAWWKMWNTKGMELFTPGAHGSGVHELIIREGMRSVVPVYMSDFPDKYGRRGSISEAHHRIVSLYLLGYPALPILEYDYRDRVNAYKLFPFDTTTTDPQRVIQEASA